MTKERFDLLSILYYIMKMGQSRGAKHGTSQEQCDHLQVNVYLRHAKKTGFSSILERFQECDDWVDGRKMHIPGLTPYGKTPIVHGNEEGTFKIRK